MREPVSETQVEVLDIDLCPPDAHGHSACEPTCGGGALDCSLESDPTL